jgi:hypothetical protein
MLSVAKVYDVTIFFVFFCILLYNQFIRFKIKFLVVGRIEHAKQDF